MQRRLKQANWDSTLATSASATSSTDGVCKNRSYITSFWLNGKDYYATVLATPVSTPKTSVKATWDRAPRIQYPVEAVTKTDVGA